MTVTTQKQANATGRIPLLAKILFWFFLNMLLLCVVLLMLARGRWHFGLDALVSGNAGGRIRDVAQLITGELRDRAHGEWSGVLDRYSQVYKVQFLLLTENGQIGTNAILDSKELQKRFAPEGHPPPPFGRPPFQTEERNLIMPMDTPPPGRRDAHRPQEEGGVEPPPDAMHPVGPRGRADEPPEAISMIKTDKPTRYWVSAPIQIPGGGHPPHPVRATLLVVSDNISGNGLFFDLRTWVLGGSVAIIVSVLFWLPLVRGITSSLSRMTRATEKIAEGNFNVRTQVNRRDELGSLSEAIDRMALRLAGFVGGQKRFLGDIAHELCSPIARLQFALGILEQQADEAQKSRLGDLREEVEQMSSLVNELLSFSKASMGEQVIQMKTILLHEVVTKAVARESANHPNLKIRADVPETIHAKGDFDLLLRAVGNIIRNSIRHAGDPGEITLTATKSGGGIQLAIEDCGPGIPEDSLDKVFDPFYRVDASRDRETGGVGLGLSIVKTCVESCGGKVRCENRQPAGLRVLITLQSAA